VVLHVGVDDLEGSTALLSERGTPAWTVVSGLMPI
jgi:hypothetical protein